MMRTTEFSSLIDANQKNDNKKSRLARYLCILILSLVGAFAVYYHSISGSGSVISSENKLFLNSKPEWYPTQEELAEYRSKRVVIEYDIEDAPETDDFNSDEMRLFHNKLIKSHGYDSNYHKVSFVVADAKQSGGGGNGGSGGGSTGGSSANKQTPLTCSTMYTLNDEAGFMELNCLDHFTDRKVQFKVTGCVSYEADSEGIRKGERAFGDSDCSTHAVSNGLTVLSGRCCRATKLIGLTTSYSQSLDSQNDYCPVVYCDEADNGETTMGCTGFTPEATTSFSGVKRTEHDTTGATGCKAQRSDNGELIITPYCAKVYNGAIRCRTFYDMESSELIRKDRFKSKAVCEDDPKNQWTITDCDSEVKAEINQCSASEITKNGNKGANFGAYLAKQRCVAMGDTENIVAVATCCVVDNVKTQA